MDPRYVPPDYPCDHDVEPETSHCGTCTGRGRIVNPNTNRDVDCPACHGAGVR